MKISNAQFTVAEYAKQMKRGDIKVNKDYQRSNAVWPLWRSARRHFVRLRWELSQLAIGDRTESRIRVPLLAIDGINCWANFARAYYLSAVRGCWSISGRRVQATSFAGISERDAIVAAIGAAAMNSVRWLPATGPIDRRWEPPWHDPNVLIKCATAVALTNLNDVIAAFSPFPKCIADWSCVRNFFAHRNGDTYSSARGVLGQYGLVSRKEIEELLLDRTIQTSRPLFWEWCTEIELRCEYLCI